MARRVPGMYFTPEATWTLGPGYENWIVAWGDLPNKSPGMLYQRPIGGRCIECHAATAMCHAGQGVPRTPPLSFSAGDEISEHRFYPKEEQSTAPNATCPISRRAIYRCTTRERSGSCRWPITASGFSRINSTPRALAVATIFVGPRVHCFRAASHSLYSFLPSSLSG